MTNTFTPIDHQFSLFDFNTMRPKKKLPISKQAIQEAKALLKSGDARGAAAKLRQIREALEDYEVRLTNKNSTRSPFEGFED
jgi:hypothetical protein